MMALNSTIDSVSEFMLGFRLNDLVVYFIGEEGEKMWPKFKRVGQKGGEIKLIP